MLGKYQAKWKSSFPIKSSIDVDSGPDLFGEPLNAMKRSQFSKSDSFNLT